ncbi:GcrA family cell cycle regulator [Candidatus Pacebacteria bacterium]|nr:GcrA family cell cycle regulator [Candidatus Paceibacterota bacterium]
MDNICFSWNGGMGMGTVKQSQFRWTDVAESRLKELREEGVRPVDIVKMPGFEGCTTNALAGRYFRLKLEAEGKRVSSKKEKKPRSRSASAGERVCKKSVAVKELAKKPPAKPESRQIAPEDLTGKICQWPSDNLNPSDIGFSFCGHPIFAEKAGKLYCEYHTYVSANGTPS